jgi:hypothetical protein
MEKVGLEGVDDFLSFFGSGGDAAFVVPIEVVNELLLSYFLNFQAFRVEAFLFELVLVNFFLLLFIVLLPEPANHLHERRANYLFNY